MEIEGTYGSQETPCTVFVVGDWYCVEGSHNVNRAPYGYFESIEEPVNVECIPDVDTASSREPIETLGGLERFVHPDEIWDLHFEEE